MKEEWVSGEMKFLSATEWVNDLCETLTKLHEITRRKESRYKTKVKEKYDERAGNINLVRWFYYTPHY